MHRAELCGVLPCFAAASNFLSQMRLLLEVLVLTGTMLDFGAYDTIGVVRDLLDNVLALLQLSTQVRSQHISSIIEGGVLMDLKSAMYDVILKCFDHVLEFRVAQFVLQFRSCRFDGSVVEDGDMAPVFDELDQLFLQSKYQVLKDKDLDPVLGDIARSRSGMLVNKAFQVAVRHWSQYAVCEPSGFSQVALHASASCA